MSAAYGPHTVGLPRSCSRPPAPTPGPTRPRGRALQLIDEAIAGKHRRLGIAPRRSATTPRSSTGALRPDRAPPDARAARAFLADERPTAEKRGPRGRLLERKEVTELQVSLWAERLGIRSSNQVSDKAALRWFEWLDARPVRARGPTTWCATC